MGVRVEFAGGRKEGSNHSSQWSYTYYSIVRYLETAELCVGRMTRRRKGYAGARTKFSSRVLLPRVAARRRNRFGALARTPRRRYTETSEIAKLKFYRVEYTDTATRRQTGFVSNSVRRVTIATNLLRFFNPDGRPDTHTHEPEGNGVDNARNETLF